MASTRAVFKLQTSRIANHPDLKLYVFLSEMIKIMLDGIGDFCLTIGRSDGGFQGNAWLEIKETQFIRNQQ
jgi:hypothetical protein